MIFAPLLLSLSLVQTGYPINPVPFTAVHLRDKFWAPKIEINRTQTIPFAFKKCEETGRIANFERAAAKLRGEKVERKMPIFPFDDSDVYKVIEGASYSLSVHPDPDLDAYVDGVIAKISAAQEPDGYLYTARTIDPEHPHDWSGKERWINEEQQSHELYDLGHLYEAAVAHHRATGKTTLLNIAVKSAELLDKTFGPGKRKIWPGHEIVEMGLAKLGVECNEPRYVALAKFFLDCRGGSGEYWQANKPVVEQREAVGHAVRATYLYSGMADIAAVENDQPYATAIDAIWHDVVSRKMYLTGGIGQTGSGEAFGKPYDLPNMSAYCETCAAVGNDYWNQRLFLLHGDTKYIDVFERSLYNGLISGVSLDGKGFFYPNPLESRGQHQRQPWFDCPCCPTNIVRFLPSLPGYFYAQKGSDVYVNLYASNDADLVVNGTKVRLSQDTNMPWSGDVKITVHPQTARQFGLNLRIPGWARNQVVPSDLYSYAEKESAPYTVKVNGQAIKAELVNGYVGIDRSWKDGDSVELELPMPVREVLANEKVTEDAGRVAIQKGPILYCAEWPDNAGSVRNMRVDRNGKWSSSQSEILGGIETLTGVGYDLAYSAPDVVKSTPKKLTLIPYYSWANRGPGEMMVWLPYEVKSATPKPLPTLATAAKASASAGVHGLFGINDGEEPKSSVDESEHAHWWPIKGKDAWVELALAKPTTISEVAVYWFDDTEIGECRVPASAKVLVKVGSTWKPLSPLGLAKDRWNSVSVDDLVSAVRIELTMQDKWSTGIKEVRIR
jgi:DUF1680 family protein